MKSIPAHMMIAINDYINHGLEPGSFLTAVICNDLRGVVGQADAENILLLREYVSYFYNEAPCDCWGSRIRMDKWISQHQRSDAETYAAENPQ
jgi:hypothetical protein